MCSLVFSCCLYISNNIPVIAYFFFYTLNVSLSWVLVSRLENAPMDTCSPYKACKFFEYFWRVKNTFFYISPSPSLSFWFQFVRRILMSVFFLLLFVRSVQHQALKAVYHWSQYTMCVCFCMRTVQCNQCQQIELRNAICARNDGQMWHSPDILTSCYKKTDLHVGPTTNFLNWIQPKYEHWNVCIKCLCLDRDQPSNRAKGNWRNSIGNICTYFFFKWLEQVTPKSSQWEIKCSENKVHNIHLNRNKLMLGMK